MAIPMAHGSSRARDGIGVAAVATPDPLTHCAGLRIEPMPPHHLEPAAFGFLTHCARMGTPISSSVNLCQCELKDSYFIQWFFSDF